MSGTPRRVVVVGGGIAGLSAAHALQSAGLPGGSCTLIEAAGRLGGKCATRIRDGFVMEEGPDSFITQKSAALDLCRRLGLESELIPSRRLDRYAYVWRRGALHPIPQGFRLTVPTDWNAFLSSPLIGPWAKFRALCEPLVPARRSADDESVARFVRRRFGRGVLDAVAGPLMAGIYVADPHRLSLLGTFPQFARMERRYGSLVRGMRAVRRQPRPPHAPQALFMSLKRGMQQLTDALAAAVKAEPLTGTRVSGLRWEGSAFRLDLEGRHARSLDADAVILAVPAREASRLLRPVHAAAASDLGRIRFVSTAAVSLGYRASPPDAADGLNGYGFIVPDKSSSRLLACTWSSSKFDGRAPEGAFLLRAFVGGSGREEAARLEDEPLVDAIRDELRTILGIERAPDSRHIARWPDANPQYDVGHPDLVGRIERHLEDLPGLVLCGGSYRGIGLPDCIESGRAAVEQLKQRGLLVG